MGKYINTLRRIIKEEIQIKEDRLGKGLGIADADKAAKIKQLFPKDHMFYKIITAVEDAKDYDMTRLGYKDPKTGEFIKGLSQILDMNNTRFGPQVRELIASGVLVDKADTPIPKKERPESTGQRGRKTSDKSREGIIRSLFTSFQEDPNFEPSEDDITYNLPKGLGTEKLAPELLSKVKNKALGLAKRGRPASEKKDDLLSKVEKALSEVSLHETFIKLHNSK
jgi:hypothetical protein